jgi:DNA-binding MarR family transcriptional regulator
MVVMATRAVDKTTVVAKATAVGNKTAVGNTTAVDKATTAISSALLSAARVMTQVRVHDMLCRQAGDDLDRSGATLLYKLHAEGDNVRLTDLAERLGVDAPAVTRKVQQLERQGLIDRSVDPGDARAFRLQITDEGRSAIERLLVARQCWLEDRLDGWSRADRNEFARLLQQFASTLELQVETRHGR